jgi:acetamidase/formamidase
MENDDAIMSIGLARPLEDAYRAANLNLVQHVRELALLDHLDAYQLVSQAGESYVGNVVDENYSVVASFKKNLLGDTRPYGGLHARLRADRGVN